MSVYEDSYSSSSSSELSSKLFISLINGPLLKLFENEDPQFVVFWVLDVMSPKLCKFISARFFGNRFIANSIYSLVSNRSYSTIVKT